MQTYLTLDGHVLDLSGLDEEQRQFLDRCITAYRANVPLLDVNQLVEGLENPLLRPTGGWVTREVWNHPLFQAVSDIEGRLSIRQGAPRDPDDTSELDPLADEWLPLDAAARAKGVSPALLRRAVTAGRVIAHLAPSGSSLCVSANSLARWTPKATRPSPAGKRAAAQRAS